MRTKNMDGSYNNKSNSMDYYNKSIGVIWENSTGNQTSGEFGNPFNQPLVRAIFVVCYIIVFALCFFGNSMVLFAIARNKRLRSRTNFLLANLAVADFSVGIFCVFPNLSTFLSPVWVLGRVMCKVYYFVWNQSYTASLIILTVIAVERFLAIKYPLKARQWMTPRKLKVTQGTIWIISILYNIHYLIIFDTFTLNGHNEAFCYYIHIDTEDLKVLYLVNFIVWYILPLTVMALLYSKIAASLWKGSLIDDMDLKRCFNFKSCSQSSAMSEETELANYATEITLYDNRKAYTGQKAAISNRETKQFKDKCISFCDDFASSGSGSCNSDRYSGTSIGGKSIRMIYLNQGSVHAKAVTKDANDSGVHKQTLPLNHDSQPRHSARCIHSGLSGSKKIKTAKRKVIRLLIALVVSFAICVLPHHIRLLLLYWRIHIVPPSVEFYMAPVSFIVLYLNSGLNPIMYALFSKNFRRSFKDSFYCCIGRQPSLYNMDPIKIGSKYQEHVK